MARGMSALPHQSETGDGMTQFIRRLELHEMDEAAIVHRRSFDATLPWLAGLHTPAEDRAFFRSVIFPSCQVWGSFNADAMTGFIAFREDWIDQLYVLPDQQARGAGGALLTLAQSTFPHLDLWTFQKNSRARTFYERRGFVVQEMTDGSRNEEREPDVRYRWSRA